MPRGHVLRGAILHADDDVAVPRPSMVLIILARARGMIRMRMIPADDLQTLRLRSLVGLEHIFSRHGKSIARRIVASVDQRKKRQDFAHGFWVRHIPIAAQQRATALVGIRLRTVCADFLRELPADPECGFVRHCHSSFALLNYKFHSRRKPPATARFRRRPVHLSSLRSRSVRSSTWTQNRQKP